MKSPSQPVDTSTNEATRREVLLAGAALAASACMPTQQAMTPASLTLRLGRALLEAAQEGDFEGVPGGAARADCHASRAVQRGPFGFYPGV